MRLLLDEMYPRRLAEDLRAAGHDVVAVVEREDLVGQPDGFVAASARDDGRVLVTENVADFAPLDPADRGALLLLNARRWPRTPGGLARIREALDAHLRRRPQPPAGAVDWL